MEEGVSGVAVDEVSTEDWDSSWIEGALDTRLEESLSTLRPDLQPSPFQCQLAGFKTCLVDFIKTGWMACFSVN